MTKVMVLGHIIIAQFSINMLAANYRLSASHRRLREDNSFLFNIFIRNDIPVMGYKCMAPATTQEEYPMIRIILANNDEVTKTKIRRFLQDDPDMTIVSDCSDGKLASDRLHMLEPDILMLDMDLPGISGFDVLESVTRMRMPYIIVTSAEDKYAARAFEFGVTDYLVKPINKYRFQEAITKVKRFIERDRRADSGAVSVLHPTGETTDFIHPAVERIPIKNGRRVRLLNTSAIRYIVADRDFANLHMITGEVIHTSERISQLEGKLPPERFQRIQRSYIVNLEHIHEIRSKKGKYEFIIDNGESFMSGYLYKRELSTLVSTWSKRRHAA